MRSISYDITTRINESLQTQANDADPKMQVVVSRAKSSVRDNSYFVVEKIKEKAGITDVAVEARRLLPYGPPDRIYNIHIDNGLVRTMHREYPDTTKMGWRNDFDIEPGKGVSITFDGRWINNKYKLWGKADSELPWLFWIDNNNTLKGQIWNIPPVTILATNVVKIDSIRGWIPARAGHNDDQGIIVAYIKTDGKVYYRNYCLQALGDNIYVWESEQEMTLLGSGNIGIRLFRTNDFRVGFIGEKPSGNTMAVTTRNWAGMSIAPENVNSALKMSVEFIAIEKIRTNMIEHLDSKLDISVDILYGASDNSFIHIENTPILLEGLSDWGYALAFTTEHGMISIDPTEFNLMDSNGRTFSVLSIEYISGEHNGRYEYTATIANINNAIGEITLKFIGSGNTLGEGEQLLDSFTGQFTPNNLVFVNIPIPEVELIYNE